MIDLKDVSVGYGSARRLFDGVDLQIPAGTICAVLGANSAGKSTLLKLFAGLTFPLQGRYQVLGYTPSERPAEFLADIFLLPEQVFVPPVTAEVYVRRDSAFYPRFDQAAFDRLMVDFALPTNRKLTEYSLGEKKKFLLAFGIATNARLLLLDEPTNGLDVLGKSQVRRALINHFDPERSFLISTHQVRDLHSLIDSVIIVANGGILLHATLEQLAERLQVQLEHAAPADALYVQEALDGFRVVRQKRTGVESDLDLELFLELVTADSEPVSRVLSEVGLREARS